MLAGSRVVVVVPAYDEAPRIGRVLSSMPGWVDAVLVVDDASRDGTAEIARAGAPRGVEVLEHPVNRGVGAALATGYRRALALTDSPRDAIAVMAGDGQMDPRDLEAVVVPIARGEAGYVKGNRFVWPGVLRTMPFPRWAAGQVLSRLTSACIGTPVEDSQCGFTALSRAACAAIDLDALWPGYGYPNDLLGQLAQRGVLIGEVPVRPVYADEVSRIRARHAFVAAFLAMRAGWRRRDLPTIELAWPRSSR